MVSLGGQKQAAGMAEGPALGLPGTQPRAEEEDSQAAHQNPAEGHHGGQLWSPGPSASLSLL